MLCLIVAERSVILDFRKSVVGIKSYKNNLFFYLVIMHILRKNLSLDEFKGWCVKMVESMF